MPRVTQKTEQQAMPNAESLESRELETLLRLIDDGDEMVLCDLQDMAPALARELLSLRRENEWISVEGNNLPAFGFRVIVQTVHGWADIGWRENLTGCWQWRLSSNFPSGCVTHWRPLPAPPAQGGEGR